MRNEMILPLFLVVVGASGTYLLLPHSHGARKPRTIHAVGAALAGLALVLFTTFWAAPAPWISGFFFYAFGLAAVAGAVCTVASRNPVHSALWFAAVVLSTAGLFLQAGASFLAVGTVIVYAGAIIVTFLFVIMLAQMEGRAPYDRAARMPFSATFTCYMLFFGVLYSLLQIPTRTDSRPDGIVAAGSLPRGTELGLWARPVSGRGVDEVWARSVRPTARLDHPDGRPKLHVAGLGETLYTDHLLTVELAGALLFVALIGALSIAAPKPPARTTDTRGSASIKPTTSTPTRAAV